MESDYYYQYKHQLRFVLSSSNTVPGLLRLYGINLAQLLLSLENLVKGISSTIDYLTNESCWAEETNQALKRLSLDSASDLATLLRPVETNSNYTENNNTQYKNYLAYFNIKESCDLDLLQMIKEDIRIFCAIVMELTEIKMDEAEVIHVLEGGMVRMNTYIDLIKQRESEVYHDIGHISEEMDFLYHPLPRDKNISTAFFRWFICHYDFAQNIIHARHQIAAASKYYEEGDSCKTSTAILNAGTLLRASTASMVFGCMLPPRIYQKFIRPSMGLGFTGIDNPQWAHFAASEKILIDKLCASTSPTILNSLKIYQEKLMQDIEVHTGIADKMIGSSTSLTVNEINSLLAEEDKSNRPATADLRNLHYLRLKKFEFLGMYPILYKLFNKYGSI